MTPRRLVTFVEGKGDLTAVPALTRRLLKDVGGTDALFVDPEPFQVHGLGTLVRDDCHNWRRWLEAAGRKSRPPVAAVLLVLDGEPDPVPRTWKAYLDRHGTTAFCPYRVGAELAHAARTVRAGEAFSLAVALAVPEFEAWLLGGIEGLRGARLNDGRGTVDPAATVGELDVERARDAKRLLRARIPAYSQTLDQGLLASKLSIDDAHRRSRSFRRLRSAVEQLVNAARHGSPVVSPTR